MSTTTTTVRLLSYDGELFDVEKGVALQSLVLEEILHDTDDSASSADAPIPITFHVITARVLAKILEYCKLRHDAVVAAASASGSTSKAELMGPPDHSPIAALDSAFVEALIRGGPEPLLFEMMIAADFLNVQSLLDLACQALAHMIRGKSIHQIREFFHIGNDFTPAHEQEARPQNAWDFDTDLS